MALDPAREAAQIETPLGPVRFKQVRLPDGRWRGKPEYEDLAAMAQRHDLSLEQVRATVEEAMEQEP